MESVFSYQCIIWRSGLGELRLPDSCVWSGGVSLTPPAWVVVDPKWWLRPPFMGPFSVIFVSICPALINYDRASPPNGLCGAALVTFLKARCGSGDMYLEYVPSMNVPHLSNKPNGGTRRDQKKCWNEGCLFGDVAAALSRSLSSCMYGWFESRNDERRSNCG